jgi:hypothetical protein
MGSQASRSVAPSTCMYGRRSWVPSCSVVIGGASSRFPHLSLQVLCSVFLHLTLACMCPGNSTVPYILAHPRWCCAICSSLHLLLLFLSISLVNLVHRIQYSSQRARSSTDQWSPSSKPMKMLTCWFLAKGKPPKQCNLRHIVKVSVQMGLARHPSRLNATRLYIEAVHRMDSSSCISISSSRNESSRDAFKRTSCNVMMLLFLCVILRSALQTRTQLIFDAEKWHLVIISHVSSSSDRRDFWA